MRVKYKSGELEPNHRIIEEIKSALAVSSAGRARTTIQAVTMIDLGEDAKEGSLDQKIDYICKTLECKHEWIDNEIVFLR